MLLIIVNLLLSSSRGSLVVNFTVYHTSDILSRQVILWNVTNSPMSRTYSTFYMEYLNKVYKDLVSGFRTVISDQKSSWYKMYSGWDISADDVTLVSAGKVTIIYGSLYK